MNSLILLLLLVVGLITTSLVSVLSPFLPALGGAFGAIVAYILASRSFEKKETHKLELKNKAICKQNAVALKEELKYLSSKLDIINSQYNNAFQRLQNPSIPDNPILCDFEIMKKFIQQVQYHYSTEKFIMFRSINKDLGKFEDQDIMKETMNIYYEVELLYVKFGEITNNPSSDKFIPDLFKGIKTLNDNVKNEIILLIEKLDRIIHS